MQIQKLIQVPNSHWFPWKFYIFKDVSMQYNCIFKYIIDDHFTKSVKTSERMLLHSDEYGVLAVGRKRGELLSLELPSVLSQNV